jgi:hypothetical protein
MPVYQLENEMPYTEMVKWMEFFKRRPVGWREDQRTHMLMMAQGVKQKGEDLFPALRLIKNRAEAEKAKGNALPSGMFLERMLKAKGGDGSKWNLLNKGNADG